MGKDWTGNGKSIFTTLGASNHTEKEREINDYYATDPIAVDALLQGGVVLDTHVGSASSLIAYHRTGVRFVGFEIDTEMYEVSNARLERERAQLSLFDLGMERNGDE